MLSISFLKAKVYSAQKYNRGGEFQGRFSDTTVNLGRLDQETQEDSEMTLMKLRRLSMKLMSKSERLRYSERKFCRSNLFKFLASLLAHTAEKVRYLTLEVLCYIIPRLGEKTSKLLKSIMPKVIKCLQGDEEKDIRLKAIHFLRSYFRHTRNLEGFIEDFVRLGLENADSGIRISCFYGLNIIFDQDIGNNLFSPLVISVANHLNDKDRLEIPRAAFRALKFIHSTVGESRFFELMKAVNVPSLNIYREFFDFESSDPFLSIKVNDCSTLASAYQIKRINWNLDKDFGILDCELLDQIEKTRNCERAKAVSAFANALKRPNWSDVDLDTHILDFIKMIVSFISDSNRLIQMSGFDILKELISRMGFILSPHIRYIVHALLETLTSANSKIKSKTERVLHKLMRNIHPMTVIWELLDSSTSSQKEAVLILVQEKIKCFAYHELDMVALCSYLGRSLEDKNLNVAKYSRDSIRLLLDIMRDCPSYGNRSEALRSLRRNYKLSRDTLKDIGILAHVQEDYLESFESYSGEESMEMILENALLEQSEASSGTEGMISETACIRTRGYNETFSNNIPPSSRNQWTNFTTPETCRFSRDMLTEKAKQDFLSIFKNKLVLSAENPVVGDAVLPQDKTAHIPKIGSDEHADKLYNAKTEKKQKHFSCFCINHSQKDQAAKDSFQDTMAGGDAELCVRNYSKNLQKEELHEDLVTESYTKEGIEVDVLNKAFFNFNIMEIENQSVMEDTDEIDDNNTQGCKTQVTSTPVYRKDLKSVHKESPQIAEDNEEFDESGILSIIIPLTPISCVTPINTGRNIYTGVSSKEIPSDIYENMAHTEDCGYTPIKSNNKDEKKIEFPEGKIVKSKKPSEVVSNGEFLEEEYQKDIIHIPEEEEKHKSNGFENAQHRNTFDNNSNQNKPKEVTKNLNLYSQFEENETPFLPKNRQLPRTPVQKKKFCDSEIIPKTVKNRKRNYLTNKKKLAEEKAQEDAGGEPVRSENPPKRSEKPAIRLRGSSLPQSGRDSSTRQSSAASKHNSSSAWGGCQWRRDLDYAAKAATCAWAENFEELINSMQPYPSSDVAESEMKKAIEDLFGNSWTAKEDAMLKVLRVAKHHPELVYDNTSKISVALSNEIKNFRQSVAGKAILTTGHLFEIMGKNFENKLRLVVGALLAKSGTRTLAAYYRLVIKCLMKITNSTAPQKAIMAFIQEGSRHANKAARETAAQFLTVLTESLDLENILTSAVGSHMIKCAATFVLDSSALTRYCGKRMLSMFRKYLHSDKIKDHLDTNTAESLKNTLKQIESKGIGQEILPINIIE